MAIGKYKAVCAAIALTFVCITFVLTACDNYSSSDSFKVARIH